MYYYLIGALKRRLILELQDSFSKHSVYRKIAPFIQNRYAFEERPQYGIVVKGSSTNKVQLSADNFVGTVESHVMLAHVGQPSYPVEWVREDLRAVQANNDKMPTLPGVYYLEILSAPEHPGEAGYFALDPLLTATNEPVLHFQSGIEREAQLQQTPVQNTLRLWDGRFLLKEGIDYQVDYTNGSIKLLSAFSAGSNLTADYRYATTSIGPVEFYWNTADFSTLPGVVLAFGKRAEAGNKIAVVVYPDRVDAAQAFGGKSEISFDLDVIARDPIQMEEISDLVFMYLWGQKKPALEFEGIELLDVSTGGEAEDVYDETTETYYFQATMSVQMRADWEVHVPLPLTISRATPTTAAGDVDPSAPSGLVPVTSDMFFQGHAAAVGRNADFERIG